MLNLRSSTGLNVELLLDRFGQLNKFRKKHKNKFWGIQLITQHDP